MDFYTKYRYLIVPFITGFGIQMVKVIWDFIKTKKWNFKRIVGAGGMPSSHAGTTIVIATMIGKDLGTTSPVFALALIFASIVMYDACGVRRETGKQAKILNEIAGDSNVQVTEKLEESVGHTPIQVLIGALIGLIVGLIF